MMIAQPHANMFMMNAIVLQIKVLFTASKGLGVLSAYDSVAHFLRRCIVLRQVAQRIICTDRLRDEHYVGVTLPFRKTMIMVLMVLCCLSGFKSKHPVSVTLQELCPSPNYLFQMLYMSFCVLSKYGRSSMT